MEEFSEIHDSRLKHSSYLSSLQRDLAKAHEKEQIRINQEFEKLIREPSDFGLGYIPNLVDFFYESIVQLLAPTLYSNYKQKCNSMGFEFFIVSAFPGYSDIVGNREKYNSLANRMQQDIEQTRIQSLKKIFGQPYFVQWSITNRLSGQMLPLWKRILYATLFKERLVNFPEEIRSLLSDEYMAGLSLHNVRFIFELKEIISRYYKVREWQSDNSLRNPKAYSQDPWLKANEILNNSLDQIISRYESSK